MLNLFNISKPDLGDLFQFSFFKTLIFCNVSCLIYGKSNRILMLISALLPQ